MPLKKQSVYHRLWHTYQLNNEQLKFGSYAAELSFYVLWAIVPILLALANVIAILPIDSSTLIAASREWIPEEVQAFLQPVLQNYLNSTSSGIFSFGLLLSLWPASNVFKTLQSIFNTIYKADPANNLLFARIFSYLFTIFVVILVFVVTSIMVFGGQIITLIQGYLPGDWSILVWILRQSWLLGMILFFGLLVLIYYLIPNVDWPVLYAIPGAVFSLIGFFLVSQLFTLYLNVASRSISNQTLGIFVILMIWLYFIFMVLSVGAYVNVFVYDYTHPVPLPLDKQAHALQIVRSEDFQSHLPVLKGAIYVEERPTENTSRRMEK